MGFYSYNAMGIDRYPPFTLNESDYPPTFDIPYPTDRFYLVIGINRWAYRVDTYILLMRDGYPVFRLGPKPGAERVAYASKPLRMPARLTHKHGGVT